MSSLRSLVYRTSLPSTSARFADRDAFGFDTAHQILPRLDEGLGAVVLQLGGEYADIDTGLYEIGENSLAVASVRSERRLDLAVVVEGLKGCIRYRVDREGRGECLDVEDVGGARIFGAGAGP